jgi:hydantoinase/carbamoylase family amidase
MRSVGAADGRGEARRVAIDQQLCAARLERAIETLAAEPYSGDGEGVTRYAFTAPYLRTVEYLSRELAQLGFRVRLDPVGNLVARNRPADVDAIGIGSHCDSVRHGGRFDGILGVLCAIEVCRIDAQLGLELPLQVVSFVEEEASGFGQMLLGSRVCTGQVKAARLCTEIRSLDDGRSFCDHALAAGLQPDRADEASSTLDGISSWLELHIEQGRVLQDAGRRLGVVDAIAGYVHGDLTITGQADHAGATPMPMRHDALVVAAAAITELERLVVAAGGGLVGTIGDVSVTPGVINAVPGEVRLSLDVRGTDAMAIDAVVAALIGFTRVTAERRGAGFRYRERQRLAPVELDGRVAGVLDEAAESTGEPWQRMISGAAHDTMCVAARVPSAMLFVPCTDGVSHAPDEHASAADAALGVDVLLHAALRLTYANSDPGRTAT